MSQNKELPKGLFRAEDGRIFLTRCPKCKTENYSPAVTSGVCVWCGFDANKEDLLEEQSSCSNGACEDNLIANEERREQ